MSRVFLKQGIKQASILIAVATISSQMLAVIREAIIAGFFGTSAEYDILLVALAIPIMIGGIFFLAIPSAGIPYLQEQQAPFSRGKIFGTSFFGINSLLILIVSLATFLVLPVFRGLLTSGMDAGSADLVIRYGRVFCLLIPFRAYEALFRALLHIKHHFLFPAITILGFNTVAITILLILFPSLGSTAFVMAWLAGSLVQTLLVAIPAYLIYGHEKPAHGDTPFNRSGYVRYLGVIVLIESVGLLVDPFDRFLCGIYLDAGYVSAAHYANIVNLVPVRIFMHSMATALFPSLSERAARKDGAGLAGLYHKSIALGIMLIIPVSVFFLLFRQEIVWILFERGAFVTRSRIITVEVLTYYLAGMFFSSMFFIQTRVFYALKAWRMLFIGRPLTLGVKIVIGLLLIRSDWAAAIGGGTMAMFVVSFILFEMYLVTRARLVYSPADWRLIGKAVIGAAVAIALFIPVDTLAGDLIGIGRIPVMIVSGTIGFGGLAVMDQILGVSGLKLVNPRKA
ncbi:MAG: hypothetical protein JSV44_08945 [Candidatus Zixiibacteriota bacterium]|nr:MAG: hypothetical protein JSV44_08945 [candidate division Zixibacteria bacterium]